MANPMLHRARTTSHTQILRRKSRDSERCAADRAQPALRLDACDLQALLALIRATTSSELEAERARLRSLLGADAEILEPHVAALRARLVELERMRRLAATDPLTGLANRRAFSEALRRELARASRSGRELAIAMFDIDDFKTINDRFGHAAGDDVLRLLSRCATKVTRNGDLLGRIGGDEIVILLPETDADQARAIADRIRTDAAALAAKQLPTTFGVSVGIASSFPAASAQSVMAAADRAMYVDKAAHHAGRSLAVCAGAT